MLFSYLNKIVFIIICLFFWGSSQGKAQSAAICMGDSVVLRMNCNYLGTLQWQQSSDQVIWSDIIGAVLDTIKVLPSSTTYYRAIIASSSCNLVYSDTAVIAVNLIPSVPSISVIDTCGSSRLMANISTGTLLWSTGQTINPIIVNSAGTYTLTQTVNGCTSAAGSCTAAPLFVPLAPTAGTNTPSQTQIVWNWNTVPDATGYKYNTVNNYNTATDNLGSLSFTQTGLTCNTAYTLYIWAYNSCGNSPVTMLTQTTSACCTMPDAPIAGTNTPSGTQIIWNWNSVSGATGYQWNTSNNYPGIGINVVASPTYNQTGLTCNTAFAFYVWAYNSCGNSTATALTQTTFACCAGTQKANFGGDPSRWAAASFSIGTKGYIGTGMGTFAIHRVDLWEWDQGTDTWTQKADFPGVGRWGATGFSIGTKGYIGLGLDGTTTYNDFYEWDQTTNIWTAKANFSGPIRCYAVGFSIGAKGYIGTGNGTTLYNDFWEWDQASDTWSSKANFGGAIRYGAVGFSIGTKGYIGTGYDGTTTYADFWEWDQGINTWTQKANFGGGRRSFAISFSINTKGYIGTGLLPDVSTASKDIWEWDQTSNTWTQKADFCGSVRCFDSGFSIGTKGYIGVGESSISGPALGDFWEYTP